MDFNDLVAKILNESYYLGSCVDSFDEDGDCIIDDLPFSDVSDFACREQDALEITRGEFEIIIKEIPQDIKSKILGHNLTYFVYKGDIFVIYDSDEDVHYFFRK